MASAGRCNFMPFRLRGSLEIERRVSTSFESIVISISKLAAGFSPLASWLAIAGEMTARAAAWNSVKNPKVE